MSDPTDIGTARPVDAALASLGLTLQRAGWEIRNLDIVDGVA